MELVNNDDKILTNISSKLQCQRHCLNEKEFSCRSAEYNYDKQICLLSRNDRRSLPEAFKKSNENVDYFENQCISGNISLSRIDLIKKTAIIFAITIYEVIFNLR